MRLRVESWELGVGSWTYRVAFAHEFLDFIVAVGSGSGRKGDSLFLCRTSRHCGSD